MARTRRNRLTSISTAMISLHLSSARRGLPIGNLTSQFFANLYLDGFDHFVTEVLRAPYVRYVDDFALFHDDPAILAEWRSRIEHYLVGPAAQASSAQDHDLVVHRAGAVPRLRAVRAMVVAASLTTTCGVSATACAAFATGGGPELSGSRCRCARARLDSSR